MTVHAERHSESLDAEREVVIGVGAPDQLVRRGLIEVLAEAGFRSEDPPDLIVWASRPNHRCVLLALRTISELDVVADLCSRRRDMVIVTLFADPSPVAYREALRSGANGSSGWNVSTPDLRAVVSAALNNCTVIPTPVAQSLATGLAAEPKTTRLEDAAVRVLRSLARGETVEHVARELGYSPRGMYRYLGSIYRRMGVDKRPAALVQAARWGLLD